MLAGTLVYPPGLCGFAASCQLVRIPCLESGSRTGGLTAFVVRSCLVFAACCLVDTLDNKPIYIHMMRPSPAHTRTRTLQERLGIQQEGDGATAADLAILPKCFRMGSLSLTF